MRGVEKQSNKAAIFQNVYFGETPEGWKVSQKFFYVNIQVYTTELVF